MSVSLIQKHIIDEGLDGWLMYDFHKCNDLMHEVCKIPENAHITRRAFVWIPKEGSAVKIVHAIESHVLNGFEGDTITYRTREEMKAALKKNVRGRIAMEVSREIPTISKVDAGTFAMVKGLGVQVVSSGRLLQKFTSVLSERQIQSHLDAADVVSKAADDAFDFIKGELLQEKLLYEGDVQEFILNRFTDEGCVTDHPPIVARGKNSANPHYAPQGKGDLIQKGDFILIDLWCKKRGPGSVFADITRVAATEEPHPDIAYAFEVVREAQRRAVALINERGGGRACDVDLAARDYIKEQGFEENILHRTGHSITEALHGNGANLDSFETMDEREIIDSTCYSVEPAIYFPDKFGLRLEHDILVIDGKVQVTGGVQDILPVLF